MNLPLAIGALVVGLGLLYFGAEWFVKGAAGLAHTLGVRPLVVGLTVVAYGTSLPEFVVSTLAAYGGRSGIALGNVIGSNVANLGLILGTTALFRPVWVGGGLIRREIPVLLLSTSFLPFVMWRGSVSRLEGVLLLLGAALFTYLAARPGVPDAMGTAAVVEEAATAAGAPAVTGRLSLILLILIGLGLLLSGGKLFVDGASYLALAVGMSERTVGLTVVAIGTSLPELAASLMAAWRGHADIAVGNVVGSNIFNVLFVLGGAAALHPIAVTPGHVPRDVWHLLGLTLVAALLLRKQRIIGRLEGALLAASYVAFLVLLDG
jgi:cation:H+ antiporter